MQGTPFEDLGNLIAESVVYDAFSPALWNIPSQGRACTLAAEANSAVSCDVTAAVRAALESDSKFLQLRIRFERAGDSDGAPDMVLFYTTNSNTNEPGIFRLEARRSSAERKPESVQEKSVFHIPVVAHLVKKSAEAGSGREQAELTELFARAESIWSKAGIALDVSFEETTLNDSLINAVATGNFDLLYVLVPDNDPRLHVFYVSDLLGPNGIALAPQVALIADKTSVDDFRATAHEIGHLLGLEHTTDSPSRLMFPGANGRALTASEILLARKNAQALEERARSSDYVRQRKPTGA